MNDTVPQPTYPFTLGDETIQMTLAEVDIDKHILTRFENAEAKWAADKPVQQQEVDAMLAGARQLPQLRRRYWGRELARIELITADQAASLIA